ncbi:alpha/beta fold hydrolase [Roseobacter sp.]|uniref:thioesterase II family protein n=1 Tax=Roseobacter sp. TaxID=1907202 RepID=UPI003296F479
MTLCPTLVCLPPAGAGPSLFRGWQRDDPQVIAPSLPGREARYRDAAAPTLEALADLIAQDIGPTLPPQYGLFGYSMGGTVAMLLAERLIARGCPPPQVVFTLGALAPDHLKDGTSRMHGQDSAAFWDDIARIGGTPDEILQSAELRALFEPTLRQDFALCHGYTPAQPVFQVPCPVQVYVAQNDPFVGPDSAQDWARFTTDEVTFTPLEGNHMLDPDAFRALRSRLLAHWPYAGRRQNAG